MHKRAAASPSSSSSSSILSSCRLALRPMQSNWMRQKFLTVFFISFKVLRMWLWTLNSFSVSFFFLFCGRCCFIIIMWLHSKWSSLFQFRLLINDVERNLYHCRVHRASKMKPLIILRATRQQDHRNIHRFHRHSSSTAWIWSGSLNTSFEVNHSISSGFRSGYSFHLCIRMHTKQLNRYFCFCCCLCYLIAQLLTRRN